MTKNQHKTELTINYDKDKLEKLIKAKEIFEQDSNCSVEMDAFIDMLVEAFLSYRNFRGATESQLLQKIVDKNADLPSNSEP
ncbi:MAG: hypothetical protein ACQCN3_06565 [Candidatus Bathyarchaeia archaeon]|jgi:hypothetical protein